MKKDNLEALLKQYQEAKAKPPDALASANEADAALPKKLADIEIVQKRVLEQCSRHETPDPLDMFTALYGKEILCNAARSMHWEWMELSERVVRIAKEA